LAIWILFLFWRTAARSANRLTAWLADVTLWPLWFFEINGLVLFYGVSIVAIWVFLTDDKLAWALTIVALSLLLLGLASFAGMRLLVGRQLDRDQAYFKDRQRQ
jgi:hypothetical protein